MLYTNVVEPILRWTFASKGYALVHAACFADGDQAFMLTARTDTGKTTTTLKLLDHYPYSFLSDDLTIVCPDGRVLAYPKPLTISRHTVHAVQDAAAVLARADQADPAEPAALPHGPAVRDSCSPRCGSRRRR